MAEIQSKKERFRDYIRIAKLRLSFSVVLSSLAGYLLAVNKVDFLNLAILLLGGFCLVGASNVFNQILELDADGLMQRTKNRPLPTGRMETSNAAIYGAILGLIGLGSLYYLSAKAAFFGALSILLYVAVYTPLKKHSPWAVFVGAFPGAIPFMLGWVAARDQFGIEPGILFLIQFVWQFPHFWSIAWLLYDDYGKADYFLLPTREKNKKSAGYIFLGTLMMIPFSILPHMPFTGDLHLTLISTLIAILLGVFFSFYGYQLYAHLKQENAKNLVIAGVVYLPLLQIIYVIDKWFIQ